MRRGVTLVRLLPIVTVLALAVGCGRPPETGRAWEVLAGSEGPGQFRSPFGLAVDAVGNLYAADAGNHRILKLSPSGREVAAWGLEGDRPGELREPSGVAVDTRGDVYIADTGNHRIQKLSPDGRLLAVWGGPGVGPGQFRAPYGVAVDTAGLVYVADTHNNRIQKLGPSGAPLGDWGNPDEGPERYVTFRGRGIGAFRQPKGVAVDDRGHLFVADTNNFRILKLSADSGEFLAVWITLGSVLNAEPIPGMYRSPRGVALDRSGNIYVPTPSTTASRSSHPRGSRSPPGARRAGARESSASRPG